MPPPPSTAAAHRQSLFTTREVGSWFKDHASAATAWTHLELFCRRTGKEPKDLLVLGVNRRLTFTDLLELAHAAKGSLSYHLRQLETAGLVSTATVLTFRGQRLVMSITEDGGELYHRLVEDLRAPPLTPVP